MLYILCVFLIIIVVFCRRKEHVKELYELFHNSLGIKSYNRPNGNETLDDRCRLFAMYHKKTHDLVKETVENEFCKADGVVRVVLHFGLQSVDGKPTSYVGAVFICIQRRFLFSKSTFSFIAIR